MIIKPTYRGAISLNPHPLGCKENVRRQIEFVQSKGKFNGPKKALIIGSSSGYGLASRIVSAFGAGADTIGVSFELGVSEKRVGTAGWWNNIWFKEYATEQGLINKNFVGDAFGNAMKQEVIDYIKAEFGGKVDLVVYSLASGMRTDPTDGVTYRSALKSLEEEFTAPTIDLTKKQIVDGKMGKATPEELHATIKVMGGEDWKIWIEMLKAAGVLAEGCITTAYSYEGPRATYKIYGGGTIGAAKRDLEAKAHEIDAIMKSLKGEGYVTVCKALVTKASAYIPLFPVYACALYKVMKAQGTHEDCVAQIERLFVDMMYGNKRVVDDKGRVRPDDLEMLPEVQAEVEKIMAAVNNDTLETITDFAGFMQEFNELNGFGFADIDYDKDVDVEALAKLTY